MGRRLIVQPNGKWCIFSTVVDNFTWYDLDQLEAFKALVWDGAGLDDAWHTVHITMRDWRDSNGFEDALESIKHFHGKAKADKWRKELSKEASYMFGREGWFIKDWKV